MPTLQHEFRRYDNGVSRFDHLNDVGITAAVSTHASFIPMAELLQVAVLDEVEQIKVSSACPVRS